MNETYSGDNPIGCEIHLGNTYEDYAMIPIIERLQRHFCETDLDIRPIYHRLFNRIEAHFYKCFVAYTIMLEHERILKAAESKISLDRARFLAEKIYQIDYITLTAATVNQSSSILKNNSKSSNSSISSQRTAKMGVPLRNTGRRFWIIPYDVVSLKFENLSFYGFIPKGFSRPEGFI